MRTIPAPTEGLTAPTNDLPPATPTIADLYSKTEQNVAVVTALAWELTDLHGSVVTTHAMAVRLQIDADAQTLSRESIGDLLDELAETGLGWRQIAQLVCVSVPAVRKWRQGGTATGENRLRIARLLALLRWLRNEQLIEEVVSWLETPLVSGVPICRLDLLVQGREDLLVSSVTGGDAEPEAVLDDFDPAWAERYSSDFEVFTADDGRRSIRFRHDRR